MTSRRLSGKETTFAEARKSAWVVGAVLLGIAAWNVYKGRPNIYWSFGGIGTLLLLVGLAWPTGAIAFHRGWMKFAAVMGAINSRIILTLIYFFVVTPFGVVGRLFGRNLLGRRGGKRDSYWIARETTRQRREGFERLF